MKHRGLGVAAVVTGIAMSGLMQTMLATAAPRIVAEFGALDLHSWVFTAYLVASTVTLPVSAGWADRRGRRLVFLAGLVAYLLGTMGCASAGSMGWLIAGRALQGAGAGALAPAAMALVGQLVGERSRAAFLGGLGVAQVAATAVGPVVGGLLTDGPGWRWALWSVVPVGFGTLVLAAAGLPRGTATGVEPDGSWGMLHWVRQPLVRRHASAAALLGIVTMGFSAFVPLLTQDVLHASAAASAGALTPMLLAVGVGSAASGKLASATWTTSGAWLLVAAGAGIVAAWPLAGLAQIGLGAALCGLGVGLLLPVLILQAQDAAGQAHASAASGLVQFARNLGGGLAVPVLGVAVTAVGLAGGLTAIFVALALLGAAGAALRGYPGRGAGSVP